MSPKRVYMVVYLNREIEEKVYMLNFRIWGLLGGSWYLFTRKMTVLATQA